MEPTLKDGDIVVVRKSDGYYWQDDAIKDVEKKLERERVLHLEQVHCSQTAGSWLLRRPPIPATGNIVVYRDPEEFPSKWNIKRVIGLGGQVVRTCWLLD
jgi:signal peptidase I